MWHSSVLDPGAVLWACAALATVLGLIWVIQALARSRLRGQGGRQLALVETIALDGRRRVHLLRCNERLVLIQTGGTGDLVVGWLPGDVP